ncbi:MAG: ABC transporter substrate-binding protein, partial [Planctomycetes bacterium]|nr:ABC transporter substrate-binding protein [Planctomycetota bacterium]
MDSGKLPVLSLVGIVVLLVFSAVQIAQKNSLEWRLVEVNKKADESAKATQGVSRDVQELGRIQERLKAMERRLEGIEENARRLENLSGKIDTLTRLGVVIGPGGREAPGGEKAPGVVPPKEVPPAQRKEIEEFEAWKKTLVGRPLTEAEILKLWAPGPDGVIRPVAPMDTTWHDPSRRGETIRRWFSTDPKGFNPLVENSADVSEVQSYCMCGLASRRLTDPEAWEYDLATSCEISDDYQCYTFTIRKGVRWQMPVVDTNSQQYAWLKDADREVTAEDFKFYVDMILNPQVQCEHLRNYFEDIDRVEAVDRYTVRVYWKIKTFVSLSATLGITPLPKFLYGRDKNGEPFPAETLGKQFNEHWYNNMVCGCGPYMFSEWSESQYVRVVRNPDYYGPPPPIEEVKFLIIRDPESAFLRLRSPNRGDRLDFMDISRTQYKKHYKEPLADGRTPTIRRRDEPADPTRPLVHDTYRNFGYSYIGWNLEKDLFKDKAVRTALSHAFPRQQILDTILEGLGDLVSGTFFLESPDYNKACVPHAFDLDLARRLLSDAGWSDADGNGVLDRELGGARKEFKFNLYVFSQNETSRNIAQIYKEQLRKIGIQMDAVPMDWALLQQKMENREFDSYIGGWALGWESDPYQLWHSKMADTPKSSNFISFRNKECDQIIEKGRLTFDPTERKKMFHRFHEILHEEQPYCFMFCAKVIPTWWDYMRPEFYKN